MPRLYFALWPTASVRERLAQAAQALDIRDGRRIRPENLHLTLCFLGEVSPAAAAALAALDWRGCGKAVTCEIGTTGWWRRGGVAWLGLLNTPPALSALRARIVRVALALGQRVDQRSFSPHVTVARRVTRAPRATGAIDCRWPVADFALVKSHQDAWTARYTVVRRWPLEDASKP